MKMSQRSTLMLGLVTSLGFSLSWNPNQFFISRADLKGQGLLQEVQLASQKTPDQSDLARTGKFDLGQYDKAAHDVDLNFTVIDADGTKSVRYYLSGKDGKPVDGLWQIQSAPVSQGNLENLEMLQRELAAEALKKMKDKPKSINGADMAPARKEPRQNPPKKKEPLVVNACDEADYSAQISCEKGQLDDLISECEESGERGESGLGTRRQDQAREEANTRGRRDNRESKEAPRPVSACTKTLFYFNQYLKKSMKAALSAKAAPEDREAALETRDQLLSELPKFFETSIKREVLALSANNVKSTAQVVYMQTLEKTRNKDYAINAAKQSITQQLYGQGGDGSRVCAALSGQNAQFCGQALQNPNLRQELESQNQGFKLFTSAYEAPLRQLTSLQPSNTDFSVLLNGDFDSNGNLVSLIDQELLTARAGGQRQSASPVPGTGAGALPLGGQGLQAPSGPVSVPSANPGAGAPFMQGQRSNMPYGPSINGQAPFNNGQMAPGFPNQNNGLNQPNIYQPNMGANSMYQGNMGFSSPTYSSANVNQGIPGQVLSGNPFVNTQQPSVYSPMAPVMPNNGFVNTGMNGGGYPMSPAQAGGFRSF